MIYVRSFLVGVAAAVVTLVVSVVVDAGLAFLGVASSVMYSSDGGLGSVSVGLSVWPLAAAIVAFVLAYVWTFRRIARRRVRSAAGSN